MFVPFAEPIWYVSLDLPEFEGHLPILRTRMGVVVLGAGEDFFIVGYLMGGGFKDQVQKGQHSAS